MQWITHTLGGKVEKAERREYGRAQLQVVCQGGPENSALFAGVPTGLRVWNSHGDHVRALPAGDRKSTRLNSSHGYISYAVFCLKKKIITVGPDRTCYTT